MNVKLLTARQIARLGDDALLAYLAEMAPEISAVDFLQKRLWAARIAVYREARGRTPAITHGRLAEAAGVSEVAIIMKLKQLEGREAAAT